MYFFILNFLCFSLFWISYVFLCFVLKRVFYVKKTCVLKRVLKRVLNAPTLMTTESSLTTWASPFYREEGFRGGRGSFWILTWFLWFKSIIFTSSLSELKKSLLFGNAWLFRWEIMLQWNVSFSFSSKII